MIKGLKNLLYEKRLKELDLFSLQKSRLKVDLTTVFQYLKSGYKEDFPRRERTRGSKYKLCWWRFHLDRREKFFNNLSLTTSQRMWWSPHHWRFLRCDWTRYLIISSRLVFL